LQADQIGGAIYQRVSGLAKTLLREIPDNVISNGADGRPGVEILMSALRAHWGGESQDKQLQLLAAFDEFDVGPREGHEDAITRFDIIRIRARDEAGHQMAPASLARKLLLAFNVPEDTWSNLLVETRGLLPSSESEYESFLRHLKRNLSLYCRKNNVMRSSSPRLDW
jgi:hypothetical protein